MENNRLLTLAIALIFGLIGFGCLMVWASGFSRDNTVGSESFLPGEAQQPAVVFINQRRESHNGQYVEMQFALVNATGEPLEYTGYPPGSFSDRPARGTISPVNDLQVNVDGAWQTQKWMGCGTGLERLTVRPGYGGRFEVLLFKNEPLVKVGVKCQWQGGQQTIWSDPIPVVWTIPPWESGFDSP